MHSALVRVQNVFGFFTTVAFSVAAVIALSTFTHPQSPSATVQLKNVQVVKGRPHYYSTKREEYAHVKFDLDADLTTLFNWNTKQVFLYLKAIYPSASPSDPPSEAVIWDAILASDSAAWHQNHWVHPTTSASSSDKSSKKKKNNNKKKTAKDAAPPAYPLGELHLDTQRPKYQITDISGVLQNRTDAYLELGWNVQPWVGALLWANHETFGMWLGVKGGRSERFDFPMIAKKGSSSGGAGGAGGSGGKKDKVVGDDDLKTEKGTEGHRLEVGGEVPVGGRGKKGR